ARDGRSLSTGAAQVRPHGGWGVPAARRRESLSGSRAASARALDARYAALRTRPGSPGGSRARRARLDADGGRHGPREHPHHSLRTLFRRVRTVRLRAAALPRPARPLTRRRTLLELDQAGPGAGRPYPLSAAVLRAVATTILGISAFYHD